MESKLDTHNVFGKTLKSLRADVDMTQSELAYATSLDRTFISMLERGLRQPSLYSLFKIAEAFNKKPSEIVSMMENKMDA